MPKIKIGRYETESGTNESTVAETLYVGWIEPADKRWILYIAPHGKPTFYDRRDPETGAVLDAPVVSIPVLTRSNEVLEHCHQIGGVVHLVFNPDKGSYVVGKVAAVKFTDYGKVLYDVRIEVTGGGDTVVESVDSRFVLPPPPEVVAQSDAEAEALYNTWKDKPGWKPWVPGGNSFAQDEARRQVRESGAPMR